jgi:regulator of protease activity HflC (stomatin/prohibitin superfamily)
MEYNKIIAVTGLPGLYELLSSKADGAIVRSLDDKTTRFVASRVHNFSHLESIEIYTVRDNVNLVDVLKAMEASPEKLPDEKDNAALKGYFAKVYPDMDFDRVYTSDLKKMVKWFSVLKANDIEIKLTEAPEEEEEAVEEAVAVEEKPVAKKKAEKAEKTADVTEEALAEEKPKAKKAAAPKKKAEKAEEEEATATEKPKKTTKKKSE